MLPPMDHAVQLTHIVRSAFRSCTVDDSMYVTVSRIALIEGSTRNRPYIFTQRHCNGGHAVAESDLHVLKAISHGQPWIEALTGLISQAKPSSS